MHKGKPVRKHGEKASPGERPQRRTSSANALISDFEPAEPGEDKVLLFKPPSLECFVMAAQANETQQLKFSKNHVAVM